MAAALNHYVRTDMSELVDECAAAYDGIVFHYHFAGELGGVGHNDVVFYLHIVSHMAVCHNKAIIAHFGFAFGGGTAMDGGTLSKNGVVADKGVGQFALELQVLGYCSHYRSGEDVAAFAYTRMFAYGGVGIYYRTLSYLDIFVNEHKRTYLYVVRYFGIRMDAC
jgi:hypothetical protein